MPAGCVALILMLDSLSPEPLVLRGLVDEAAHAATAIAFAALLWPLNLALLAALLGGGVLLDVDHIPATLGWDGLTAGTPRPYTHSLLTVAALAAAAKVVPSRHRRLVLAVMAGVLVHLWRDLATGGVGVSLFWPIDADSIEVPYSAYLAGLGAILAACGVRWLARDP